MNRLLFGKVVPLVLLGVLADLAQAQESRNFGCPAPREDALPPLCAPPPSEIEATAGEPVQISLTRSTRKVGPAPQRQRPAIFTRHSRW